MRLTQRHMLQMKNLALEQKHHTQCDQCQISQRKITKIFLLKEECFKSVQQISEGDWENEIFPRVKIERRYIWELPSEHEFILPCTKNFTSNNCPFVNLPR